MTKFIPAVSRYTAKPKDDYAYEKPSFSYFIDRDKTGCINGQLYHGVVVAKLSGGARDLANIWTKRDVFKIRELEDIASLPTLVPLILSLRARLTAQLMISGTRMRA